MHSLRTLLGTFRQIPCGFFTVNVTDLNDQETDDNMEKIQCGVTFQSVWVGGAPMALAHLTKAEKKVVTAETLSQFISPHLLNVINSPG